MSPANAESVTLGVIADTHGLLRAEALEALAGVDAIVHAGDIGPPELLARLEGIAPLHVVRGNVDRDAWCDSLPVSLTLEFAGQRLHMRHILAELDIDPAREGIAVVVSGHSHKPSIETRQGVLYLNPGSAGPRRFRLPITLARLELSRATANATLVELC